MADPISEEDENQIQELIEEKGLTGLVIVKTGSSFDQVMDLLPDTSSWGTLNFADGTPGLVVAFTTGVGDGYYPVFGLYKDNELVGVELEFIE